MQAVSHVYQPVDGDVWLAILKLSANCYLLMAQLGL